MLTSIALPASAVPLSVGWVLLAMLSLLELPVSSVEFAGRTPVGDTGAVVSMVKVSPLAVVLFPAASVDLMIGV